MRTVSGKPIFSGKPRGKPRPREKDVQALVLDYLTLSGAVVIRANSGATKVGDRFIRFNSAEGCSDILACYKGRFLAVEVKRDQKAKATPKQLAFLESVRQAGGIGVVVCDLEGLRAAIQEAQQP